MPLKIYFYKMFFMAKTEAPKINFSERLLPAILVVMVGLSVAVGALWQKVENLKGQALGTTTASNQPQASTAPKVDISQIKALWDKNVIKFGKADNKVLFVEILDPSCPYCHIAGGLDAELNKTAGFALVSDGGTYDAPVPQMEKMVKNGQASMVIDYYPGHGYGEMAMKAMYCAYEKGDKEFWAVHDLLLSEKGYQIENGVNASNQPVTGVIVKNDKTKSGDLASFLKSAIDPSFMKSCLDSGKYDQRLADDMAVAGTLNVSGTPGFFVNDSSFPGAYSWTDMKPVVDAATK